MDAPSQAEISRLVRAAVMGARGCRLSVTGVDVEFSQGTCRIKLQTAAESAPPAPIKIGDEDELKAKLKAQRNRNAARRA